MKSVVKGVEHKNDELVIIATSGETLVIENLGDRAGQYTQLDWVCESDVIAQFDDDSQEVILEALNQTADGCFFA